MNIPSSLVDDLIYLDPNFIAMVYEEVTKEAPTMQISNDLSGELKVSVGIAGFGGTLKETRTYTRSSFQMLQVVQRNLEKYPNFNAASFSAQKSTQTCWMSGNLTIGEWCSETKGNITVSQTFELIVDEERQTLIVQRDLFRSGIGFLTEMESALSLNMDIPVTALCRVLFVNPTAQCHVACPYIILGR